MDPITLSLIISGGVGLLQSAIGALSAKEGPDVWKIYQRQKAEVEGDYEKAKAEAREGTSASIRNIASTTSNAYGRATGMRGSSARLPASVYADILSKLRTAEQNRIDNLNQTKAAQISNLASAAGARAFQQEMSAPTAFDIAQPALTAFTNMIPFLLMKRQGPVPSVLDGTSGGAGAIASNINKTAIDKSINRSIANILLGDSTPFTLDPRKSLTGKYLSLDNSLMTGGILQSLLNPSKYSLFKLK